LTGVIYKCIISRNHYLVLFTVCPKILPFSFGEIPSNAGDSVQVVCTVVKGDKPLRISWNFYGEELSSNMGITTTPVSDSMNVLSIPSVGTANRGNYTCVAKNSAGYDSFTAQLLVNGTSFK
jgi:hypothetical protein